MEEERSLQPNTSSAVRMMRQGVAPIARAASILPGWIATRFCSTMRATENVAAMIMTNTAAFRPMVVPTTSMVTGAIIAMRMMKGIGRMKFTRKFSTQ